MSATRSRERVKCRKQANILIIIRGTSYVKLYGLRYGASTAILIRHGQYIGCHRDFSRFSEDRPSHTEYGFEAVTLSVCVSGRKLGDLENSQFCGSRWSACDPFRVFIRASELSEGPIERLGPS